MNSARVATGITKCAGPPGPDTGSTGHFTANRKMNTMPTQKLGKAWPRMAKNLTPLSSQLSRCVAATTPRKSDRVMATIKPQPASARVLGSATLSIDDTVRRCTSERPRSPWRRSPM